MTNSQRPRPSNAPDCQTIDECWFDPEDGDDRGDDNDVAWDAGVEPNRTMIELSCDDDFDFDFGRDDDVELDDGEDSVSYSVATVKGVFANDVKKLLTGLLTRNEEGRMSVEEWLAIRKRAALEIDPETAEVQTITVSVLDPYGVEDLPPECINYGRDPFFRSPGSDVWVWFGDLPEEVFEACLKKKRRG